MRSTAFASLALALFACTNERHPPHTTPTGSGIYTGAGGGSSVGVGGGGGAGVTSGTSSTSGTSTGTSGSASTSSGGGAGATTGATTGSSMSSTSTSGDPCLGQCTANESCVMVFGVPLCTDGMIGSPCGSDADCAPSNSTCNVYMCG